MRARPIDPEAFERRLTAMYVEIAGVAPPSNLLTRLMTVAARGASKEERGALRVLLRALYADREPTVSRP